MKVLIADVLPPSALAGFEAAGFELSSQPALKDAALIEAIAAEQPQILVVRSTEVPRAALEAGPLALVIRAGAGVNNVDVAAASQLGVYVANCPGKNAIAVAELTWGLILSLDRQIPACTQDLRAGKWNKKGYAQARGLFGRTLGVIGLGEIGRQVVARAKAFGMPVVAWSRSLDAAGAEALGVRRAETIHELAAAADVVSVHVALTDETRGLIDEAFFAAMRPEAFFVNTSRGAVVQAEAIQAQAAAGRRCGLDVWNLQPSSSVGEFSDPLGQQASVLGTHHIGASTDQAQEAVADEALRVARVYRDTGAVPNCVNLAAPLPSTSLVVRHLDRVGVLAAVLERLRADQINVQHMKNVLFSGPGAAACATIQLSAAPSDALLSSLRELEHVLAIRVTS